MNTRFRTRYPYMEEAGTGAPGGGAAAPAAAPAPAAAAPAPAPTAAPPAPGTGAQGVPWLAADTNTDLVGHAQNKAWKTAADVVQSHRELEKLLGADRAGRTVVIPTDENDAAGWEQVYNRLGRPVNAEGYKLPVPQGQDPAFARAAAAKFHELGVPAKMGEALASWWNGEAMKQAEAAAVLEQQAVETEHTALKKDWGAETEMRTELAKRAAVTLGLDEASIDALQKSAGFTKTLKALAKMGDMLKEHGAEGMGALGSFAMTPEGAKARKAQLMADTEWRKKAMDPKSAEWAELKKLDGILTAAMQQAA